MAVDERIQEAQGRLAREGIEVSVRAVSEGLLVHVEHTAWTWPHTWLRVFQEFMPSGYGVKIF